VILTDWGHFSESGAGALARYAAKRRSHRAVGFWIASSLERRSAAWRAGCPPHFISTDHNYWARIILLTAASVGTNEIERQAGGGGAAEEAMAMSASLILTGGVSRMARILDKSAKI
jgi:hypothetical protein